MNPEIVKNRVVMLVIICLAGFCYGAYLTWRGITHQVPRGPHTGDPVIPPGLYITGGCLLMIITTGSAVAIVWTFAKYLQPFFAGAEPAADAAPQDAFSDKVTFQHRTE